MKFLCICNHGNCRSYALARILKYSGHEAINIGIQFTTQNSLECFVNWADVTVILTEVQEYKEKIYMEVYKELCYEMDIGPDRWGNPFHPELHKILVKEAEKMFIDFNQKTKIPENMREAPVWSKPKQTIIKDKVHWERT